MLGLCARTLKMYRLRMLTKHFRVVAALSYKFSRKIVPEHYLTRTLSIAVNEELIKLDFISTEMKWLVFSFYAIHQL